MASAPSLSIDRRSHIAGLRVSERVLCRTRGVPLMIGSGALRSLSGREPGMHVQGCIAPSAAVFGSKRVLVSGPRPMHNRLVVVLNLGSRLGVS